MTIINRIRKSGPHLVLTGRSHTLSAMPVGGSQWVGMIAVDSPTDSAMLMPYDALALREWLNERLALGVEEDRPDHDDAECARADEDNYALDLCLACYTKRFTVPKETP